MGDEAKFELMLVQATIQAILYVYFMKERSSQSGASLIRIHRIVLLLCDCLMVIIVSMATTDALIYQHMITTGQYCDNK